MISVTSVLIVAVSVIFYYYFFHRDKRLDKYPSGPFGLPLVGHLFQMGTFPHETFKKWSKKYGKTFSIRFLRNRVVVLHDPKMIREMFNEVAFSGVYKMRRSYLFRGIMVNTFFRVLHSEGRTWEEQRRFTLRHLRDFGFGKNAMELLINEEVREITDWMKSEEGRPISVNRKFSTAALNSLWIVISGRRFDQKDTTLNDLFAHLQNTTNEVMAKGVGALLPSVAKRFPQISGYNKLRAAVTALIRFLDNEMEIHKENATEGETNDFMQCYMTEVNKTTDSQSSFHSAEGEKNFKAIVSDLFTAGAESISMTLTWTILYLLKNPDVQKKLHEEIDNVLGKSRTPSLNDRPQMPYTEAVIHEVLRYSSSAAIGVPHRVLFDTEFNGYFFPKGTWIMFNLHAIHHDKNIWGDPEKFRPERFIENGKVTRPEAFLPFVAGKRVCLGEVFARDSLFLFLTGIFQRFQMLPDPANNSPSIEPAVGFILSPKPYTVVMQDRYDF